MKFFFSLICLTNVSVVGNGYWLSENEGWPKHSQNFSNENKDTDLTISLPRVSQFLIFMKMLASLSAHQVEKGMVVH